MSCLINMDKIFNFGYYFTVKIIDIQMASKI